MSLDGVNGEKPVKITRTGEKSYTYEYADGTIKCVFDEKNSIAYNKNENKNIKIESDWGDVSVFNGKNLKINMEKSCTGLTLENCKDSEINSLHHNVNAIRLKNSVNMTIKADQEDIITSNGEKVKPPANYGETIKVNDKPYPVARMMTDKDADANERIKIYNEQLFSGFKYKNIKIEENYFSSGLPIGGESYKKASFPNGDVVIKTENGNFIEYNNKNNPNIKINSSLGSGLHIKNANGASIISTKIGPGGVLENSANCTYTLLNDRPNSLEIVNSKNTTVNTDRKDEVFVDGKKIESDYGKRVVE